MRVLAVTCYTGNAALCDMTERMLGELGESAHFASGCELWGSVVAQGVDRVIFSTHEFIGNNFIIEHINNNKGFAFGMNLAIAKGVDRMEAIGEVPDYILCINNDIEMPDKLWLSKLLAEASSDHINSPVTDVTSTHAHRAALDVPPYHADNLAAYCWLVPFKWCLHLKEKHGFWLFSTEFGLGYAEDNWTEILLRMEYGDSIFRIVPRAWVKHLKAQTAKVVKPDRRRSSGLLKKKIKDLLKRDDLSLALRNKLKWYCKVLR